MPDEQPLAAGAAAGADAAPTTLLDSIIQDGKMAKDPTQKPYAKDLLTEFVGQILDEGMTVSRDTVTSIKSRLAQIDELISSQLNEIMHAADFQALEATWRGLH